MEAIDQIQLSTDRFFFVPCVHRQALNVCDRPWKRLPQMLEHLRAAVVDGQLHGQETLLVRNKRWEKQCKRGLVVMDDRMMGQQGFFIIIGLNVAVEVSHHFVLAVRDGQKQIVHLAVALNHQALKQGREFADFGCEQILMQGVSGDGGKGHDGNL